MNIQISLKEKEIKAQDRSLVRILKDSDSFFREILMKWLQELFPEFDGEVSLLFCADASSRELNLQYRKKDKPTDVLSFPQFLSPRKELAKKELKNESLGDIVINAVRAKEQCAQYGNDFMEEIIRLLCHGLLHLLGYDHEKSNRAKIKMQTMEKKLMAAI